MVLIFAYLVYKGLNRVVSSKCHYSSKDGWEIDLPDLADEPDPNEIALVNQFMAERGISMKLRHANFPSIV